MASNSIRIDAQFLSISIENLKLFNKIISSSTIVVVKLDLKKLNFVISITVSRGKSIFNINKSLSSFITNSQPFLKTLSSAEETAQQLKVLYEIDSRKF